LLLNNSDHYAKQRHHAAYDDLTEILEGRCVLSLLIGVQADAPLRCLLVWLHSFLSVCQKNDFLKRRDVSDRPADLAGVILSVLWILPKL
jgi:hypothetical protein